jgi:uncharacterized protein (DUF1778 family)
MCAVCDHITPVPTVTKELREERLVARVSGRDKELLARAAALEGLSVATFVIIHARDVARRIVADSDEIKLDAAQSRRFVEALLKPTPPAPVRLRKAAKEHRRRIVSR